MNMEIETEAAQFFSGNMNFRYCVFAVYINIHRMNTPHIKAKRPTVTVWTFNEKRGTKCLNNNVHTNWTGTRVISSDLPSPCGNRGNHSNKEVDLSVRNGKWGTLWFVPNQCVPERCVRSLPSYVFLFPELLYVYRSMGGGHVVFNFT
jgi:hypothetical protein